MCKAQIYLYGCLKPVKQLYVFKVYLYIFKTKITIHFIQEKISRFGFFKFLVSSLLLTLSLGTPPNTYPCQQLNSLDSSVLVFLKERIQSRNQTEQKQQGVYQAEVKVHLEESRLTTGDDLSAHVVIRVGFLYWCDFLGLGFSLPTSSKVVLQGQTVSQPPHMVFLTNSLHFCVSLT